MNQSLRENEAATTLGITARRLAIMRRRGGGPVHLRIGNLIHYDTTDLELWTCRCPSRQA